MSANINGDGSYALKYADIPGPVLLSDVEADVDAKTLHSSQYPRHTIEKTTFRDQFGPGDALTVTHTGLPGEPDLVCSIGLYREQPWGEVQVTIVNTTAQPIFVHAIRSIHTVAGSIVNLNGPDSADRVISDSFSEDRPQMAIRDLADGPNGTHRAVGSQLIYNRDSGISLFVGALTSDKLLTLFHLREQPASSGAKILSYDATATGTTEIQQDESLKDSPPLQQVPLSLRLDAGESLASERLLVSVSSDYHAQLEHYGSVIRTLHSARVNNPTPIGWWSWTAYYFGLNQGTAITNAQWLAQNLKESGYKYFQIDEGYQYARGEYSTPDVSLFPRGLGYVGDIVRNNGLTFGLWTAPFEVSKRAWVFENHKDWLLHNAGGELIQIEQVAGNKEPIYVLDVTNPGAQDYLRHTYSTLRSWGVRFIKMDFMDDTAVEGAYYRPNTTALEAQRIGLQIIRSTVGEDVVLDKDGSPMLNPVGVVDSGRISQDTGHAFRATKAAASGIAARYYMNRNFFVADPDAFNISTQTANDRSWHGEDRPITLDEARASIALSAISGGMFEIGDDLPTLGSSPDRLALARNKDLLDIAQLGHASIPVDLLTYTPDDEQPSTFLLKEDSRQSILTVFNWTDKPRRRSIGLASLGLRAHGSYKLTEVFGDQDCCRVSSAGITLVLPPHSVRMIKLIDDALPASSLPFEVHASAKADAGQTVTFRAYEIPQESPVLTCHWDFGDGSAQDGMQVDHAFTEPGEYSVRVTATGLDSSSSTKTITISVSGNISTRFAPEDKNRPH